jgi:hypothetical protein
VPTILALSLALAGAALYLALDARHRARTEAQRVGAAVAHPKLVVEEVDSGETNVPADGYRHNVQAYCHYPDVVFGGGYAPAPSGRLPEILASTTLLGQYLVGAANERGRGSSSVAVRATCAHGEGGLAVEGKL